VIKAQALVNFLVENSSKFVFNASNNEAEYEALIVGIELCYTAKAYSDSQLVISQLNGD